MKTNGNEPINPDKDWGNTGSIGLTKREYFAAMAMQGLCPQYHDAIGDMYTKSQLSRYVGEISVAFADALIEELNK